MIQSLQARFLLLTCHCRILHEFCFNKESSSKLHPIVSRLTAKHFEVDCLHSFPKTMYAATTTFARTVAKRASSASRMSPQASSALLSGKRSYHENIVEHYENPRNVGSLDKNDDNVGTVS